MYPNVEADETAKPLPNSDFDGGFTPDDREVFEAARTGVMELKRTFEHWVAIGKAVVRAREIADRRGGAQTFMNLIKQQGLDSVVRTKGTASKIERVMRELPAVIAWREGKDVTDRQRIDWPSPVSILRHCPRFKPPPVPPQDKPLSKANQT